MKIFDAHCDTLTYMKERKKTLRTSDGMISLDMLRGYDGYVQVFAAWIDSRKKNSVLEALELAALFRSELTECDIRIIEDKNALEDVFKNGEVGALLAIEDGRALGKSLGALDMFYRLGVRSITLTWNGRNELGDGAVASGGKGLTEFGKSVVKRMNELGMVIDVSHLSERGFYDVCSLSEKPFVASHSNAKAICAHPRNLTDEQLRVMIERRSACGINFYTGFLSDGENATISDVIRHIEHILSLGGENILGIGSDFDGINKAAKGLENAARTGSLYNELLRLNYSEELLLKLMYKNFMRVYSECL